MQDTKGTGSVAASGSYVYAVLNNAGATATIESGTYNSANSYAVQNAGTFTITNGTFEGTFAARNVSGTMRIENGTFTGGTALYCSGATSTTTVTGGTFTATGTGINGFSGVLSVSNATIEVMSATGAVNGIQVGASTTADITDTQITVESQNSGRAAKGIYAASGTEGVDAPVTISGNTVITAKAAYSSVNVNANPIEVRANKALTISGNVQLSGYNGDESSAVVLVYGTLAVEGGTFTDVTITAGGSATVNITGGTFISEKTDWFNTSWLSDDGKAYALYSTDTQNQYTVGVFEVDRADEAVLIGGVVAAIGGQTYKTIEAAIAAAAENGGTVTLLTSVDGFTVGSGNVTLDLNGYNVTAAAEGEYAVTVAEGAALTIVGEGNVAGYGGLQAPSAYGYSYENNGTLKLHGGSYAQAINFAYVDGNTVGITEYAVNKVTYTIYTVSESAPVTSIERSGETYYFANVLSAFRFAEVGDTIMLQQDVQDGGLTFNFDGEVTFDLNGHDMSVATSYLFSVHAGTLTIVNSAADGSTLTSTASNVEAFRIIPTSAGTTATLSLGENITVRAESYIAVLMQTNYGEAYVTTNGTEDMPLESVLISSADIIAENDVAIQGNGTMHGTRIEIDGGSVVSENSYAIYHPQYGKLTIANATVKGGITGIEIRAGILEVRGSTIIGSGDFSEAANGNGTTVSGAAVAVSQHTTNLPLSVTIEEGSVLRGEKALYEKDLQDANAAGITLSVTGGSFEGEVYSQNVIKFIENGTFYTQNGEPNTGLDASYLAEGLAVNESGTVVAEEHKNAVAMVVAADGSTVYYENLAAAFHYAADGATIDILKNVADTDEGQKVTDSTANGGVWLYIQGKSLTVNGNGHTLTASRVQWALYVINATATGALRTETLKLTINDLTVIAQDGSGYPLGIFNEYYDLTLNNVTLDSSRTTLSSSMANLKNTAALVFGGLGDTSLAGSGKTTIDVTINGKSVLAASEGSGYAVWAFNPIALTVSNSELSGWAALNMNPAASASGGSSRGSASSTVTLRDTEIITYGVCSGGENNFGAIVLNDGNITVTVIGGSVTLSPAEGAMIQSVVYYGNVDPSTGIVTFTDTDITLEGNSTFVWGNTFNQNDAGDVTVAGGTFNFAVTENYLAAGYAPLAQGDGTYAVVDAEDAVAAGTAVAQLATTDIYGNPVQVLYATLQSAVNAAEDGDTVTLLSDITVASGSAVKVTNLGIELTIDLNGCTITSADNYNAAIQIWTSQDFVLTSSKEGAAIVAAYALNLRGRDDGAVVAITVENIAFSGSYVYEKPLTFGRLNTAQVSVTLNNVQATYTDGTNQLSALLLADRLASLQVTDSSFTITSTRENRGLGAYAVNLTATTAVFTGSTITANGTLARGIYSRNYGTTISDLTLINTAVSAQDIAVDSLYADLTVNGGSITSTASAALLFFGHLTPEEAAAALTTQEGYQTLTLTGGVTVTGYTYGVSGNAEGVYDGTVMNIEDAVISGGEKAPGVFQPHVGILNIGGENTKISGSSGIVIRAGELNITGGTIEATKDELTVVDPSEAGSGSVIDGAAVAISQHSTNQTICVNISDGLFKGAYSLYEETLLSGLDSTKVTASLTGGTYNGAVGSENMSGFVTDGTFSDALEADYLDEAVAQIEVGGNYVVGTVQTLVSEQNAVAKVEETGIAYTDLQSAINAAPSGATVTLLCNVNTATNYYTSKNIILDLGGNTITSTGQSAFGTARGACDIIVKNGNLVVNSTLSGQNTAVFGVINTYEEGSTTLQNVNITVNSAAYTAYGVYAKGKTMIEGGTIDVNNTADDGWAFGVAAQAGTLSATGLTIGSAEGTTVDMGIAVSTGNEGSVQATITNATVYAANTAVSVEGGSSATIISGTYTAPSAVYMFSSAKTEVANGTFNGWFYGEDGAEVAINGGYFSEKVPAEYMAQNYALTEQADGTYSVVNTADEEAMADYVAEVDDGEYVLLYTDLQTALNEAADGATVTLLKDITVNTAATGHPEGRNDVGLYIWQKSLTIEGNNKTIRSSAVGRLFQVIGDNDGDGTEDCGMIEVTIKDLTIISSGSSNRPLETRGGNITLNLNNVTLDNTDTSVTNSILFAVGGNSTCGGRALPVNVNIAGSKLTAMQTGYAFVAFNPVTLKITDKSELSGYGVLWFDGPTSSYGSRGSVATVENSTLTATNNFNTKSDLAAIILDDSNVRVTLTGSTVNVIANGASKQATVLYGADSSSLAIEGSSTVRLTGANALHSMYRGGEVSDLSTIVYTLGAGVSTNVLTTDLAENTLIYYNEEAGLYTVISEASASEADIVAAIGNVGFTSLQSAINAAEAGATVRLLDSVTESVTVTEEQDIVLDLGGYTLSSNGRTITNRGTLTVKNGTVVGGGSSERTAFFNGLENSGEDVTTELYDVTLTLENVSIHSNNTAIGVALTNNGAKIVSITGGKITAQPGTTAISNSGWIGSITGTEISVEDSTGLVAASGKAIVLGGDVNCADSGVIEKVSGCTIKGVINVAANAAPQTGSITMTDNTFDGSFDCGDGFYALATENGYAAGNESFVIDAGAVAAIESTAYTSLQAAFNAVEDTAEITLLADITVTSFTSNYAYMVAADQNIVLDFNGHTINATEAEVEYGLYTIIMNNGTLMLTDTSAAGNGGMVDQKIVTDSKNSAAFLMNQGTLTVEGGVYEGTGGLAGAAFIQLTGTMNVYGGTFRGVSGAPINQQSMNFMVQAGMLTFGGQAGTDGPVLYGAISTSMNRDAGVDSTVTIAGGTIYGLQESEGGERMFFSFYNKNLQLNITGGTLNGVIHVDPTNVPEGEDVKVAISGTAAFKDMPPYAYFEKGYMAAYNETTGMYVTEVGSWAASVNDETAYATLGEALAAAEAGDTVTLLTNVALTNSVTIDKSLTLDLNGKTVTASGMALLIAGSETAASGIAVELKNGTIESAAGNAVVVRNNVTVDMTNVNVTTAGDYAVFINPEVDDVAAVQPATVNITGGTIEGNFAGAVVIGVNNEGTPTTLTANGTTFTGGWYGISGEGTSHNTYIELTDCTVTGTLGDTSSTAYKDLSLGLYHPQEGTLIVNGGSITGVASGIEMRAGSLTVTGDAVITATAVNTAIGPNGSGNTIVGAAIAVSQHSTNLAIDVNLAGGTYNGVYALCEADVQAPGSGEPITMSVTGGTYNGGVYSENVVGFITGGNFKQQPAEELLDENYAVQYAGGYFVPVQSSALTAARANAQADVREYAKLCGVTWSALSSVTNDAADEAAAVLTAYEAIADAMTLGDVAKARLTAMVKIDEYIAAEAQVFAQYKAERLEALRSALAGEDGTADDVVLPTATWFALNNAATQAEFDEYYANALAEIEAIRSLRTEISGQTQQLANLAEALEAMSDGLFGDTESGTQGAFAELLGKVQTAISDAQNAIVNGEEGSTSLASIQEYLEDTINKALERIEDALTNTETGLAAIKKALDTLDVSSQLADEFGKVAQAITNAQDAIMGSTEGVGGTSISEAIKQINETTQGYISGLRKELIGENGTSGVLGTIATAVQGLTDLNIGDKFGDVLTAITNAQNAIMGVTEEDADGVNLSEVLSAVNTADSVIDQVFAAVQGLTDEDGILTQIKSAVDSLTQLDIGGKFTDVTNAITDAQNAIMGVTEEDKDGTSIAGAVTAIEGVVKALTQEGGMVYTINETLNGLSEALTGTNNNAFNKLAEELKSAIIGTGDATLTDIAAGVADANSKIGQVLTAVQGLTDEDNGIVAQIKTELKGMQDDLDSLTGALLDANSGLATDITDALEAIDQIAAAIGSLGTGEDDLATQIGNIVSGLEDVQSSVNTIGDNLGVAVDIEETKTNAVAELENWLSAYLDTLLGTTDEAESGVVMLAVTLETEDGDLYGRLTQAYSEANAQLILKYYNQALTAIDNATSTTDVSTAVATFRAQVASVDAAAQNTPSMTGVYVLLAIVLVVLIAASIVVILKNRKAAAVAAQPAAEAAAEEKPAEEAKPEAAEEAGEAEGEAAEENADEAEAESTDEDKAEEELAADEDGDKERVVIAANVRSFAEAYVALSDEQRELFNKVKDYALSKEGTSEAKLSSGDCVKLGSKQVVKLAVRRGNPVALFVLENEMLKDFRRGANSQAKLKVRATELVIREEADLETAYTMVDLAIDQIKKDAEAAKERRRELRRERRRQRLAEEAAKQAEHDGSED